MFYNNDHQDNGNIIMPLCTLIITDDGKKKNLVQVTLTQAIHELCNLSADASLDFCSIEGIDGFILYQNYKDQIRSAISIFEMFEHMPVEDIAKCMLLAVEAKIPVLETPKHIHLFKAAQRVSSSHSLKLQAKHFMHFKVWQGFEFLAA